MTPLECLAGDCSFDYAPPKYPLSCTRGSILVEGVCEGARYRAWSDGYGEETLYWNAKSGKLVAKDLWTDTMAYCGRSTFHALSGDVALIHACEERVGGVIERCRYPELYADGGVDDAGTH